MTARKQSFLLAGSSAGRVIADSMNWRNANVGPVVVPSGGNYELIGPTGLTAANKLTNVPFYGYEPIIVGNTIQFPAPPNDGRAHITMRAVVSILAGSTQAYSLLFRRGIDDSILGDYKLTRSQDSGANTVTIVSYIVGASDPFLIGNGGIKLTLANNSGPSCTVQGLVQIAVNTVFTTVGE